MCRHGINLVARVAAGDDFQTGTAEFAEFAEEAAQLAGRHAIARRVRDHRQAAGRLYPAKRLIQCGPFAGNMARLARHQETLEDLTHACGMALRHQVASKMRAAENPAAGQRTGTLAGTLDTGPGKTPADLFRAPVAKTTQSLQAALQRQTLRIDVQPQDMHGLRRPADRYLDARHQVHAERHSGPAGGLDTGRGVMIGQRQYPDTGSMRGPDQVSRG